MIKSGPYQKLISAFFFSQSPFSAIFQGDEPMLRVQQFSQINFMDFQSSTQKHPEYQITMPSKISMTNAKTLKEFIQRQKITENIRIIHALAHIEFNAFLAYADTAFRFCNEIKEPKRLNFLSDISNIAKDQGRHFLMLASRLEELGYFYGYLPVISNLTETIYKTQNNLKGRLGAISILHEGKGMKSISRLINKLKKVNDQKSIPILEQIQKQEVGHFLTGRKWFMELCTDEQLHIDSAIQQLNKQFDLRIKKSDFKFDIAEKQ